MFARVRNFVRNHWRKALIGGVTAHLMVRLTAYFGRRYLTYQQQRAHDLFRSQKKRQLFEMMEENFRSTFRNWFLLMKENIKRNLNAEKYTEMLKTGEGDKYENWMELKMIAFTNILALVYGSSMLSVILRIQVNAISGIIFKQTNEVPPGLEGLPGAAGDACTPRRITEELQQDYMVLTRYLCTDGMDSLCSFMYEKARHIVSKLSLKQKLSVSDIEQIFMEIRNQKFNDCTNRPGVNDWCPVTLPWRYMFSEELMKKFLYPDDCASITEDTRDGFMRTLFCDVYDLVTAEDARTILKFLETQGINHYIDRVADVIASFPQTPDADLSHSSEENASTDLTNDSSLEQPTAYLAKLIPLMNSFISVDFTEDTWAAILLSNESLKSYSANVYESYSCKDFFR